MKILNYIVYSSILLFFFNCTSNEKQSKQVEVKKPLLTLNLLEGSFKNSNSHILLREYISREVIDTLSYIDSLKRYQTELPNKYEDAYYLTIDEQTIPKSAFLTHTEDVHAKLTLPEYKEDFPTIEINTDNESFQSYNDFRQTVAEDDEKLDQLKESYYDSQDQGLFDNNTKLQMKYDDDFDRIEGVRSEKVEDFIARTNNLAALFVYDREMKYTADYDYLNNLLERFEDTEVVNTPLYIKLNEFKNNLEATSLGHQAPNFSAPNPEGEIISVNDFKGEYLLIDFWASWCKPCRKANPELVEIYREFHPKGIEFFGVSYDYPDAREKWLEAIKKDNLTWPQVSELKGWDTDSQELYSVFGIPYQILLDKDGKVLARNKDIQEQGLRNILEELDL